MPIFGKKPSRKKRLGNAFDIPLSSSPRDKAAEVKDAAKDKAIRVLAREKKKEEARQAAVDKADELKEKALKRRVEAAERKKQARTAAQQERTACTCHKPRLAKNGKCVRCHKVPASRRRGLFG